MSSTITGAKPKRVARVPREMSVRSQAKKKNAADKVCLKQPLYVHWLGLEMLKAYKSAISQIEKEEYPIKIHLDESMYEIERDSLKNVTDAIKSASTQCQDTTSSNGGRGLMGCPELRQTEVAFSSLVSRALDRFIFPNEVTGACLHQAPCRKIDKTPERPDIYIVQFNSGFVPGNPLTLSDIKRDDFDHADRESSLYSSVGVEEGNCLHLFPVLIGIPCALDKMELQLHVNVANRFWKLVVTSGQPWDGALLCTLKAGIHHLIENNLFMMYDRDCDPIPFKDMRPYSILGQRKRVFLKKDNDTTTVIKFFDILEDDYFHPFVMEDLIKKIPTILPEVKLTPCDADNRVYMLEYTYIEGKDGSVRTCQLKEFVGVVKQLSEMHKYEFVHGDVRLANMVFSKDGKSSLIDFDFVGNHNRNVYASSFNYKLKERHQQACPNSPMLMEHDRFGLECIIRNHVLPQSKKKTRILSMLTNLSCSLEQIASLMEQM